MRDGERYQKEEGKRKQDKEKDHHSKSNGHTVKELKRKVGQYVKGRHKVNSKKKTIFARGGITLQY